MLVSLCYLSWIDELANLIHSDAKIEIDMLKLSD